MMISWAELALVAGWLGLTAAMGRNALKWLWPHIKRMLVEWLISPYLHRLAAVEEKLAAHIKDRYRHGGTEHED